jgi:hypothetical protein
MKKITILFICIFLIFISLPLLFIDTKSTVSEKENRILATLPTKGDNIKILPRMFDDYFNDRFGFREFLISSNISYSKKLIGIAVLGKNNWFFFRQLYDDFFKINLFNNTQISVIINEIESRVNWCNDNNIKFIFLIPPNKHNVYPEYYPFDRPEGITRIEQILTFLPDHLKNIVIYPLNTLLNNKSDDIPLYFETDTHWNMKGAYYAHLELTNHIRYLFPETDFPDLIYLTDVKYETGGDIIQSLRMYSTSRKTVPNIQPVDGWEKYYHIDEIITEKKNAEDIQETITGSISINNDSSLPKAFIFHDSFYSYLRPFTSTLFSSAEYYWHNWNFKFPINENYILENKPDIIIWELTERFINHLLNSD